jgi:hypothetical protein
MLKYQKGQFLTSGPSSYGSVLASPRLRTSLPSSTLVSNV